MKNIMVEENNTMYRHIEERGEKLVAGGTTVVRTLESVAKSKIFNKTNLFIFPPYDFKMVDNMITNFHLPKSSLMILVEAFTK
jgi:S-adenosylmethionine:tRNA ribosyltransferase-isomerase